MRLFLSLLLLAGLAWAERPAQAPRPATLRDAPRKKGKKGKYKAPKPHTAKRARNAHKHVKGKKEQHPQWGTPKGK